MRTRLAAIFPALAILFACSGLSRDARIEAKLEKAGVKPRLARCLAPKLAHDLSDDQLRALANAAKASPGSGHGAKALRKKLEAVNDPETADIVSRAAIACAITG